MTAVYVKFIKKVRARGPKSNPSFGIVLPKVWIKNQEISIGDEIEIEIRGDGSLNLRGLKR